MRRLRSSFTVLLLVAALLFSAASGRGLARIATLAAGAMLAAAIRAAVTALIIEIDRSLELYREPESEVVICRVPPRTKLRVIQYTRDKRWAKLKTPAGQQGWAATRNLPQPKRG